MRIAMISTPFVPVPPRDYGGTELVVAELVDGLTARGHEVVLFATGDSTAAGEVRSLYSRPVWPPDHAADLNHVSWAMATAAAGGFDVVHAHSPVALALRRLAPGVPLVYTLHHDRVESLSSFYAYFDDAYFVAISEDQRSRETEFECCRVIHHGLDPSRFQWRERPGAYVCFVGRLAEVKGPHTAIDAARSAGVPIRVAGEVHAVDRDFGEREVKPRLGQPHVRYLGCIGIEEKAPLLRDALALLAPIEWNEPFGLILIEAMLSGCPVVAFPRGSVPELVEPGVTGYIVEDARALAEAIRPGGPLATFDRRRCRERAVERFGRDRMVRDYESWYRAAMGSTAASPPPARRPIRVA